ncbi:MAG: 3-phosphoglycerate dehydrogenase [Rikenellaceae bacterium]|nr:3-phosphoglycerate dehydrogenase [Rikenellaceae bacterium]
MKILLATEKPFSAAAVGGIKDIVTGAGHELALLEKYTDKSQLLAAVSDAEAIIIRSDKITAEVIAAAPKLKIVVRAGAGYDNVDLVAATDRGIVVMNTPGQNSNAVAELAIAMAIYMARNQFNPGTGSEIAGKRMGCHAFGNIGKLVARYAHGFGMTVYASGRRPITDPECDHPLATAEELYKVSDVLSIHLPSTDQTRGMVGRSLLSLLPKGAIVVNTARKEVINEAELMAVLEERPDLKYATDVKPDNYDALREKFGNRVFATPKKMGAETAEANINAGLAAARQIVGFFATGDTTFQVNK